MSAIVTLHLGGFGARVGYDYWRLLAQEHAVPVDGTIHPDPTISNGDDATSADSMKMMFEEKADGKFVPRSIFGDLEPDSLRDAAKLLPALDAGSVLSGKRGSDSNFALGRYGEAERFGDAIFEVVRRRCEACDCLAAFKLFAALSGGTGSGLGALLACKLKEEYSKTLIDAQLLFPSGVTEPVCASYNTVFSLHELMENSELVTFYDNTAVSRHPLLRQTPAPSLLDLNPLIAQAAAAATSTQRAGGSPAITTAKLATIVPFPRLHFFIPTYATAPNTSVALKNALGEVGDKTTPSSWALFGCQRAEDDIDFANAIQTISSPDDTSPCPPFEVEQYLAQWWRGRDIGTGFRAQKAYLYGCGRGLPVTSQVGGESDDCYVHWLCNSSSIRSPFSTLMKDFDKLFRRKAYVHHYLDAEGSHMDLACFTEAECNSYDLISEWNAYAYASMYEEEGIFEEDDDLVEIG